MSSRSTLSESAVAAHLRAAGCVFAEDEARLILDSASDVADLTSMIGRRVAGEPLEHIVGWVRFCGLKVDLDPGVFIPRQRTEFLVRQAAAVAHPGAVVLDLCCGSGAIGVALTSLVGRCELHAADIDPAAVRCARRNLEPVGGHVYEADLFEPLPNQLRGRIGLLVANVPYVPSHALGGMPAEAREHEPPRAHDGGADGLDVLRRMLVEAGPWLAPRGRVMVEIYRRQARGARNAFARARLDAHITTSNEYRATVAAGANPAT